MLESGDRLVLPHGVAVRDGLLADEVRGEGWPLNAAGELVLARVGASLAEIVDEVAATFALPVARARADVLAFVWQLNRLSLANLDHPGGRLRRFLAWLRLAARLLPAGAIPHSTARRHPVDTTSIPRSVLTVFAAVWGRAATIALVGVLAVAHVEALAGGVEPTAALAIGAACGGGLAFHEAAHAAALRGVPTALVVRGRRTYLLHAALASRRRALVALAGPLAVAAAGVAAAGVAAALGSASVAIAAGPLCAHAAALTVLASDGRVACGL